MLRGHLPTLPTDEQQLRYTGSRGRWTLAEAFAFYQVVSSESPRDRSSAALDFGCGWGRITRCFIKDYPKDKLFGVDPSPEMIEVCRVTDPWATFNAIDLLPPIDLPDGSLDLIFAFSVFSHLTEQVHLEWLREFSRLLRRGGHLVVTTRERNFILECERLRNDRDEANGTNSSNECATAGARTAFDDTKRYLDAYDRGEYCCDAFDVSSLLTSTTYGETCIPFAYARDRWRPEFSVVKFLDGVPGIKQNIIVARRT